MLNKIDFSPGVITYDEFDIDPQKSFAEQMYSFKEDMFQVSYKEKYTIDVGWRPDFEENGFFRIKIVVDYDWINPLYFKQTNKIDQLVQYAKECSVIVRNLIKNESQK